MKCFLPIVIITSVLFPFLSPGPAAAEEACGSNYTILPSNGQCVDLSYMTTGAQMRDSTAAINRAYARNVRAGLALDSDPNSRETEQERNDRHKLEAQNAIVTGQINQEQANLDAEGFRLHTMVLKLIEIAYRGQRNQAIR